VASSDRKARRSRPRTDLCAGTREGNRALGHLTRRRYPRHDVRRRARPPARAASRTSCGKRPAHWPGRFGSVALGPSGPILGTGSRCETQRRSPKLGSPFWADRAPLAAHPAQTRRAK
jgi:hypothetical protein